MRHYITSTALFYLQHCIWDLQTTFFCSAGSFSFVLEATGKRIDQRRAKIGTLEICCPNIITF